MKTLLASLGAAMLSGCAVVPYGGYCGYYGAGCYNSSYGYYSNIELPTYVVQPTFTVVPAPVVVPPVVNVPSPAPCFNGYNCR